MIEIVQAEKSHIEAVCKNLRGHELSFGFDLKELLSWGLDHSKIAETGLVDGEPALIWGVEQQSLLGSANTWMATTELVTKFPHIFAYYSKKCIQRTLPLYGTLSAHTQASFLPAVKWLQWLGFVEIARTGTTIKFEAYYGD